MEPIATGLGELVQLRAGLIVALAIPLPMLFAGNLMLTFGIAGSLMSLGAIDFGLIVDSAVIVIENIVRHLSHAAPTESPTEVVRRATLEVRKPVVFGVAIITMVNLPILALQGVEGKMFRPMALTLIFALTGSLLLSLTATLVLAALFLRPGISERETWPVRIAQRTYAPVLRFVIGHALAISLLAIASLCATIPMALSHGSGAEVQRPLATVVIGGLFTSTLLNLIVIPAIYRWFDPGLPPADEVPLVTEIRAETAAEHHEEN
ncbi:MAG: efflux RND transporter permease subunit [Isosphaeraceae bacterium]